MPPVVNLFKRLSAKLKHTMRKQSGWIAKYVGNVKLQILLSTDVISHFDASDGIIAVVTSGARDASLAQAAMLVLARMYYCSVVVTILVAADTC